jgi:inosine/xanthosine triphosphate pyrophosphatase family protein
MHDAEKDAISHRGRALMAFKSFIQQWIDGENHDTKNH